MGKVGSTGQFRWTFALFSPYLLQLLFNLLYLLSPPTGESAFMFSKPNIVCHVVCVQNNILETLCIVCPFVHPSSVYVYCPPF